MQSTLKFRLHSTMNHVPADMVVAELEFAAEGGKWVPIENVLEVLNAPSPKKGHRP